MHAHRREKQVILTTEVVTTEAVLAALSYSEDDDGKAYWYELQNLFVKICLIMKTNLNSRDFAAGLSTICLRTSLLNLMPLKESVKKVFYMFDTEILKRLL